MTRPARGALALLLLKANRVNAAIETLSSALPGVWALARAGTGWDDTGKGPGKGIEALAKEWEDAGRVIRLDRAKFPAKKPAGQSAFIRAQAEQSLAGHRHEVRRHRERADAVRLRSERKDGASVLRRASRSA